MIGIFDSGIGGLTVAREVMRQLPGFSILYLGDTARTPYGNKSPELLRRYALEDAQWMISRGAKLLIVACNSMSALATQELHDRCLVPVFDVIVPTVRETARLSILKRIGVIGTRATINSRIYEGLIHQTNPGAEVFTATCPLFVPLVEEGWLNQAETHKIARAYLTPLREKNIDTLILGCTHYPLLTGTIQAQMGRKVKIIDSAEATVRHIKDYLDANPDLTDNLPKGNRHEFYLTDVAPHYDTIAGSWLGRETQFRLAELVPLPTQKLK